MHPSGCLVLLNHETFLEIYLAKINNIFPASNRLLTKIPQKCFRKLSSTRIIIKRKWHNFNRTILDALKAPTKSIHGRKREVEVNKSAVLRKKHSSANTQSAPKSISPKERLAEFPNQHFKMSKGVLFCEACRDELSVKRSALVNHIKSLKHVAAVK